MDVTEYPVFFHCEGERLLGICHQPTAAKDVGVVIVVGGPQYRVGSHRQFVLLARYLAEAGIAVFRFDYRSMGDSTGNQVDFEQVTPDIRAAVDAFSQSCPELEKIVLWGLCDAASAILLYALEGDARITGQILLNPWVRTDEGIAKVYLKNYYLSRLLNKDLWRKLIKGRFLFRESWASLSSTLSTLLGCGSSGTEEGSQIHYTVRMLQGMEAFAGRTLVILSGNDMTADEFRQHVAASANWQKVLNVEDIVIKTLPEANHTFSKACWRDQLADICRQWVQGL